MSFVNDKFNEKWTDTIPRDNQLCGIGTANNQLHRPNGTKVELHPNEDRSFAFAWKDDVYVYGLLDGFNGPLAVDMFNEYLLVDLVFEDFENKNDFEIFEMIDNQILKTESKLEQYLSDKLTARTIGVHDPQERERLDREISSGLFLTLSFIIGKKIFTVSVGTVRSFLILKDSKGLISFLTSTPYANHTLTENTEEEIRISRLNGIISPKDLINNQKFISHTRCLGDFKIKLYFTELEQFKDCKEAPIINKPDHYSDAARIDEDSLFMVMYSDALAKSIEKTGFNQVEEKITSLLIEKIKTEVSINSAAQSVVDEIKRDYDNCCIPGQTELREDITLILRVFRSDLKEYFLNEDYDPLNDTIGSHSNSNSLDQTENSPSLPQNQSQYFDEQGYIIPYVKFDQFYEAINNNFDANNMLESLQVELEMLTLVDDTSRL